MTETSMHEKLIAAAGDMTRPNDERLRAERDYAAGQEEVGTRLLHLSHLLRMASMDVARLGCSRPYSLSDPTVIPNLVELLTKLYQEFDIPGLMKLAVNFQQSYQTITRLDFGESQVAS